MIQILITFFSVAAFAQGMMPVQQVYYAPDECTTAANMMTSEMIGGMPSETPAFSFGDDGKTEIRDQKKIVKREVKNGTESITYKAQRPKIGPGFMLIQPLEYETIERTVIITRDSNGRMTSISKPNPNDMPKLPNSYKSKEMGWPLPFEAVKVKSMTNEFSYDGDECHMSQSVWVEKKDKAFAKEEKKIYFDKKLCDEIMPEVSAMGHEQLENCSSLMSTVEAQYDKRSAEVAKEGKSFKNMNFYGQNKTGGSAFNLLSVINGCIMSQNLVNYGMVGGIGMGGFGMYGKPMGEVPTNGSKGRR
jgi:hypothetical protein